MNYQQFIETMSPEVYSALKRAVETGRWPDGRLVTPEQREHSLQAIIAWGERNLPEDQRVGYIDRGHKAGAHCDDTAATPVSWRD